MAKLFSDENFPLKVTSALRQLGHDVVTIQERGRASEALPDVDVLAMAIAEDRAVLTQNRRHFIVLHRNVADHAGIIVCTVDPDFSALAARIHHAIHTLGDLRGRLIRINRPNP